MLNKFTSRKFCSALIGIITGISLIAAGNQTEGTALIISSVVSYILAEGFIDAKAINNVKDVIDKIEDNLSENEEDE